MSRTLFTDRTGGIGTAPFDTFNLASHVGDNLENVELNRQALAHRLELSRNQLFFMNQVHGRQVAVIDEKSDYRATPTADALFTMTPGLALVTLVADCVPVILTSSSAVAAVHVGRQGLIAGVCEATVEIFASHGILAHEISAEIGPSICRTCYEVDLEMYRDVTRINPATATDEQLHCLDIAAGLKSILDGLGITWIQRPGCTMHDLQFFSYRRDGVTGRQAGVVAL